MKPTFHSLSLVCLSFTFIGLSITAHKLSINRATNFYIMQSGRFYSQMRKIFQITYNSMDKIFPESGRLSNLCTRISLKIRKSSAESGRVGSSAINYARTVNQLCHGFVCGSTVTKYTLCLHACF